MSVHPDRGRWVVRWRDNGTQRARRFKTEAEANAFHEGVTGGAAKAGSSTPNVYPYETSDGVRWRYSYRDSRGRLSTKRGFLTERAAARDREERMGRVRQGTVVVSRMTFGEFFPEWLRRRRPYVTEGTWADYEVHGRKRLLPHFGPSRLTAITTFEVSDWLLEFHEAGEYAPKTLNNALGVLVAALNGAVADQLLPLNPAAGVERLPLGHLERDWLGLHEISPYLGACSPVYRPLAELLIGSGMRISEAVALRWDDVDFRAGVVRVYRSAKREGEGATKGKRFRSVQVGPELLGTLRDLRARSAETRATDLTHAPVFTMPIRRRKAEPGRWRSRARYAPVDRNTVSRDWHKQALAVAALRDMPLHALRHTAAASWLLTGHALIYVQRQLGHASITTTESFYGHLEESFLKSAPRRSRPSAPRAEQVRREHSIVRLGCRAAKCRGARVARAPAGPGPLEPFKEVSLYEAQGAIRTAESHTWNPPVLGRPVQPRARHAEHLRDLRRPQQVSQALLGPRAFALHLEQIVHTLNMTATGTARGHVHPATALV